MPPFWSIEFRVEPCIEHMHVEGFVLRIEGAASPEQNATMWVVRGGWMEQPETHEIRTLPPFEINWERAHALIEELRNTMIHAAPIGLMGMHATTHKLTIECGFNSASYKWWHELPSEWRGLSSILGKLTQIAYEFGTPSAT